MTEAQTRVLALALQLERKAAHGRPLSADEQALSDLAWIDTMVAPDGFEGWLYATGGERIAFTLAALDRIGAGELKQQIFDVLAAIGIDPSTTPDDVRQDLVDAMPDGARVLLERLDSRFYDGIDDFMGRCLTFAESHGLAAGNV